MTAYQQALVDWAKNIANDNRYHYYYYYQGDSNLGPWGFDCATYVSYVIYKANGWNDWPDRGYFWPWTDGSQGAGYDAFLLDNGWQKYNYDVNLLTEGAIIITYPYMHHTLMYVGNNELCDANDFGGSDFGDNSIAIRSFPYYSTSDFQYIYIPPNVTPGPGPGPGPGPDYFAYTKRRRRRVFS